MLGSDCCALAASSLAVMLLLSWSLRLLWLLLLLLVGARGCDRESKVGGEGWGLVCVVS